MPRRTLARHNLLTFAAQPWNLFEDDPNAGGGGGGPQLNEHGYPEGTPVADMDAAHQVAYWKHHARKHEARANSAPDAAELERLRAADAELATRKAADLTETERLQAERDAARAEAEAARAEAAQATATALRLEVATAKGLTARQAERLRGATREELEADADDLLTTFGTPAPQGSAGRSGGPRGSEVGGTKSVSTGAERYRERHGKN
ncbi:hypothetical protein AB0N28_03770 [Streptomyces sp. NPDC051130]|uniref:hypothetical protein n=1 Tax=Streptomyces sp. NPDC051130 TaxID=3157223 RepID=UPI00341A7619